MINNIETVDFHAHILPCADHGSSGLDITLEQLKLLNNAGVDTVVATPHFYPNRHTPDAFISKIERSVQDLLSSDVDRPKLCVGAEVLYCDGLDKMEGLRDLCVRGTDILLLELPMNSWNNDLFETVQSLIREYTVVLAHIDRYAYRQADQICALLDMGALAQINASSLFFFSEKKHIMPFVKDGQISAIGSDLHEADKKCAKHFAEANKKLGDEYLHIMERANELLRDANKL